MELYDICVKDNKGEISPLYDYRGKVILIVNTATSCGLTPQYKALQELYVSYKDRGFEILDFPCNQFLHQAKGSNQEIAEFCSNKYGITFKQFYKINVNGKQADPLYVYLKSKKSGMLGRRIKWNFTKFLIDKNGVVIARYSPTKKPKSIANAIEDLL